MKPLASRTDRDTDDIKNLYQMCGLTTAEEGIEILPSYYPARIIPPRAQFILQELFPNEHPRERDTGIER